MKHEWDGIGPQRDCLIEVEVGDRYNKKSYWVQARFSENEFSTPKTWEYELEFPSHFSIIRAVQGATCFDGDFDPCGGLNDSDYGPTSLQILRVVSWAELP